MRITVHRREGRFFFMLFLRDAGQTGILHFREAIFINCDILIKRYYI